MPITRRHIATALIVIFAMTISLQGALAQSTTPTAVRVTPATQALAANANATITIEVVAAQQLYGFEIGLSFDPERVEVVDADPETAGVQISQGAFLDPGFTALNLADNTTGVVRFAMTQLNPSEPQSGDGPLLVITLRGKQTGLTPITLANVVLASRDGLPIAASLTSSQIEVVSANTRITATPTPLSPTATATAVPTLSALATRPAQTASPTATVSSRATATPTAPAPSPTPADAVILATSTATVLTTDSPATPALTPAATESQALPSATVASAAVVAEALTATITAPTPTATPVTVAQATVTEATIPSPSFPSNRTSSTTPAAQNGGARTALVIGIAALSLAGIVILIILAIRRKT